LPVTVAYPRFGGYGLRPPPTRFLGNLFGQLIGPRLRAAT
jgi:hypothetical protein